MYAVVRDNTFESETLRTGGDNIAEFQAAHAARVGYRGSIEVDAGDGRRITLTLWNSREDAEAARVALGPVIQHTLTPLMAKPSALIGTGEVIFDDIPRSDPAPARRGKRRPPPLSETTNPVRP